jgi:hypothetical protein
VVSISEQSAILSRKQSWLPSKKSVAPALALLIVEVCRIAEATDLPFLDLHI